MTEQIRIKIENNEYEFPLLTGTENEKGIDLTSLRKNTGCISYDPGFGNTGSCKSEIAFINGEKGILRYRGVPIEELAENGTFIETAYLLIWGELPTREQKENFSNLLT